MYFAILNCEIAEHNRSRSFLNANLFKKYVIPLLGFSSKQRIYLLDYIVMTGFTKYFMIDTISFNFVAVGGTHLMK